RDQAANAAIEILGRGYALNPIQKLDWLIEYYTSKKNLFVVANILENQKTFNPQDADLYARLADVYAKLGQKDKALAAAREYERLRPEDKAKVDEFIKNLQ